MKMNNRLQGKFLIALTLMIMLVLSNLSLKTALACDGTKIKPCIVQDTEKKTRDIK